MITEEDRREMGRLFEDRTREEHTSPWSYDGGEVPGALQDDLGISTIEYILEKDRQYLSTTQIASELEIEEPSPNKIGSRMRLISRTLEIEDDETNPFYSSNTTWDLDALKDNGLKSLYGEITG